MSTTKVRKIHRGRERVNEDLVPLISAFTFVFLAELGDKTQLTAMALSCKSSAVTVFSAAMAAFFLVDGTSALIGGELLQFLPTRWVSFGSGVIFLAFGIFSFVRRNKEVDIEKQKTTFFKTLSLVALMELGDKTQFASVVLAAELKSPFVVLGGIMLAFAAVTGISVFFGSRILKLAPEKYLKAGTSLLFMLFGLVFILGVFTEISLF